MAQTDAVPPFFPLVIFKHLGYGCCLVSKSYVHFKVPMFQDMIFASLAHDGKSQQNLSAHSLIFLNSKRGVKAAAVQLLAFLMCNWKAKTPQAFSTLRGLRPILHACAQKSPILFAITVKKMKYTNDCGNGKHFLGQILMRIPVHSTTLLVVRILPRSGQENVLDSLLRARRQLGNTCWQRVAIA